MYAIKGPFNLVESLLWISLLILALFPYLVLLEVIKPEPYEDVEVVELKVHENAVVFEANFYKNEVCIYDELGVFVKSLGTWKRIAWYDLDPPHHDRLAGGNTLRIGFALSDFLNADRFEIRTRHFCDGVKVDKVFYASGPLCPSQGEEFCTDLTAAQVANRIEESEHGHR